MRFDARAAARLPSGITDAVVNDNAISVRAARLKGIASSVAGCAGILVVPDLEAGNMLFKQLEFLGRVASAGIVPGARVPIVLTSHADSVPAPLASCAGGRLRASMRRAL
ncbi:phosphate acyltransferase [Paraburkholderia sp.]|uniref:phosphate acyltransferase n=1 Tax=Paraburkholderia sp. TaxID=1926495 RepID=UPI0039C91236